MRSKELVAELNSTLQAYVGQPCYVVGKPIRESIDEPYIEEFIIAGFMYDGKRWCVVDERTDTYPLDDDFTYGFTTTLSKEEAEEIYNKLVVEYERKTRIP